MALELSILAYLPKIDYAARRNFEEKLKQSFTGCQLTIQVWNTSNSDASKQGPSNKQGQATFSEICVEVYCEAIGKYTFVNYQQFYHFRQKWEIAVKRIFIERNYVNAELHNLVLPLMSFKQNKAYKYIRKNSHEEIHLETLSFGTYFSSCYAEHIQIFGYICVGLFMHDSGELSIQIREPNKSLYYTNKFGQRKTQFFNTLKLKYKSIKRIIVNANTVLLELIHQPTLWYGFSRRLLETVVLPKHYHGRSNAIKITFENVIELEEITSRMYFRSKRYGTPVFYSPFLEKHIDMPFLNDSIPYLSNLDFSCQYLIEALIRRNCKLQLENFAEFISFVRTSWIDNGDITEEALSELVHLSDSGHSFNYLASFKILFDWHKNLAQKTRISLPMQPKVRKVIVTPTKILFWPPEIMIQNRIIRNFDKDYSLRVSFRDENYNKLSFVWSQDDVVIKDTIKPAMLKGLTIGNRKFEFLAWSNSQIRDHGVWMYATDEKGNTASTIRSWMGDFSGIYCVSKYMARMGQCFSQTRDTGISLENFAIKDDICRGTNPETMKPYCFSDGIGRISSRAVSEILNKLDIKGNPSAFQIRHGGKKGMLVLDPTLKKYDVVFRPSMVKFPCQTSNKLEICDVSSPLALDLNRPLITILNQNGIENHVFLRLQEDALQSLTDMFFEDDKAGTYLTSHQNLGLDLKELIRSGISPTEEPFLRGMLLAAHLSAVDKILNKANLPIDPADGRNMFGVLDETARLEYGEVFIQYTKFLEGHQTNQITVILTGPVMVTKNPCYNAGDVRILQARDVQQLHHHKDTIVFPQNGPRPHPNEMSGSDLDGDQYTVIWTKDFIFRTNDPPSHFPSPTNPVHYGTIRVSNMVDWLCDYIASDNIGMIASTHLAVADHNSSGIRSAVCKDLSRKCSVAVDFVKSGVKSLKADKPTKYPDFMGKSDKTSYKSKKALGVLYRTCLNFCECSVTTSEVYSDVTYDRDLEYFGWESYEASAINYLDQYTYEMEKILVTYGVKNESEAMSSCFSKIHDRYNHYKDRNEVEELIKIKIKDLVGVMKDEFHKEFTNNKRGYSNIHNEILKKASAWYMVTYKPCSVSHYLSFPWVVSEYLAQIKNINACPPLIKNPVLSKFSIKLTALKSKLTPLDLNSISQLQSVNSKKFPLSEFVLASQILVNWAQYRYLTTTCNLNSTNIVQLLLHICKTSSLNSATDAIKLIITFLKFFMSLRFQPKGSCGHKLPFYIKKLNVLAKESMITYRHLAITGTFESFGDFQNNSPATDVREMDPFRLPINAMECHAVETLKSKLVSWSECEVQIRQVQNCLIVSAWGLRKQIQTLRNILNKGPEAIAFCLSGHLSPLVAKRTSTSFAI